MVDSLIFYKEMDMGENVDKNKDGNDNSKEAPKLELKNEYLKFIQNCNDKELQKRFYTQYLEYKTRIAIEIGRCVKSGIVCVTIIVCFCIIKNLLFK